MAEVEKNVDYAQLRTVYPDKVYLIDAVTELRRVTRGILLMDAAELALEKKNKEYRSITSQERIELVSSLKEKIDEIRMNIGILIKFCEQLNIGVYKTGTPHDTEFETFNSFISGLSTGVAALPRNEVPSLGEITSLSHANAILKDVEQGFFELFLEDTDRAVT